MDLVMQETVRIRTEPVSEEELFVAKGSLIDGIYQMLFEDGHATSPDVRTGLDAIRAS